MVITGETKYRDFVSVLPFLCDGEREKLYAAAEKRYGYCNALTLDQFFGVCEGNIELLGDMSNPTVLQVMWLERFEKFTQAFTQECERMTVQPSAKMQRAMQGTRPLPGRAALLVFCRQYFGLPSFAACGSLTVGEYLTARQDHYNEQIIQRNFAKMQEQELKKHKH